MVSEDFAQELVGTLLVQVDDGVVQWILVLLEPAGDVVSDLLREINLAIGSSRRPSCRTSRDTYNTSIMADGEVGSSLTWLWWFWFLEVGWFTQVVVHQLFFKGLVGSLGEHRLFLKDWQDTQRLYRENELENVPRNPQLLRMILFCAV